jgi:hypothetical protein
VPIISPERPSTTATAFRPAERSEIDDAGKPRPRGRKRPSFTRRPPLAYEFARSTAPARAEHGRVVFAQRQLVCGSHQVRQVDLLVLVVEDRRLDRDGRGTRPVAAEELVERVVAPRRTSRGPVSRRPARPHIWRSRRRSREGHARCAASSSPDVDAELERVGRDDGEQVALRPAGARSRAAAAACSRPVGRDPLGQVGPPGVLAGRSFVKRWISSTPRRGLQKQIVRTSSPTSARAAGRLRQRRRALPVFSSSSGGFHIATWRSAAGAPSSSTS